MKIQITTSNFDTQNNAAILSLKTLGCSVSTNPFKRRLSECEVKELLSDDVVGLIAGIEPLTRDVLASATALKVISRCGVAMENVDLVAAAELGISVLNTPNGPTQSVAELTIALMLNVLRKIGEADALLRKGDWKALKGHLLSEQTVGIVGYGRIGRAVAVLLKGFGAKVLAYDITEITDPEEGVEVVCFDELIRRSNIVSLHLPYLDSTHNVISKSVINAMLPNSFLINVARGGLVDESALCAALEAGHLKGAGLDVFSEEPYKGPLCEFPQVVLTAHIGSYAMEARQNMEKDAALNLVNAMEKMKLFKRVAV